MACSSPPRNVDIPGNFKHVLTGESQRRLARRNVVAALFLAYALAANGAAALKTAPPFRQLPPLPSVREAAATAGMSLGGFGTAEARGEIRAGDSVTMLVSLTDGADLKQWVIELEAQVVTAAEKEKPHGNIRTFSSTGHELKIEGFNQPIRIRMIGPFEKSDAGTKSPGVKVQRVLVNGDFLAIGMARVPEMFSRLSALHAANPKWPTVNMGFRDSPFPADVVARESRSAALFDVTAADERAFIGSFAALVEFAQLTAKTPGVKDIFIKVVDVPWWSILTSGGNLNLNLNSNAVPSELKSAPWGLSASERVYASSSVLSINGKPALLLQLAVTAPNPPLAVSAGIIGMAAVAPNGKGPVMTFQVVSSRVAGR
ncbi:MAG: hypothetical protein JWM35_657 [Verrucomicrobia bacterium]|nr:hypothetical protein [Verrucomicrobiota bacterium]